MPGISRTDRSHSTTNRTSVNRTDATTSTNRTTRTDNTNETRNTFGTQPDASLTSTRTERSGLQRTAQPSTPALASSINNGHNVRRGAEGQSVRELQEVLNRNGANLQVDGDFGPRTQQAVREYQRQNGLQVDGVVGPNTFRQMQGSAGTTTTRQPRTVERPNRTNPANGTNGVTGDFATEAGRVNSGFATDRAARERQAEEILRANGAWPPEDGRAYAIQIDQDAPPASASTSDRRDFVRSYSGETAVFRAENGRLVEQEGPMRSASHPGQFSTSASGTPDVNRDGRRDVANIRPGVYRYNTRTNGRNRYNPITNSEFRNAARDTNQDGTIDGAEANQEHAATAIQIHVGGSTRPSSVGCQTMPPGDYARFQNAIRGANTGGNNEFTYVLVRRPNDQFGANAF